MAMTKVKKRFSFRLDKKSEKVLFCPEVRDFIAESSKCQTLYANSEGFYDRRVGSCRENKLLKEFIFNSMYYNEEQSQSNSDRMMHVTQICDKMITLNRKYHADDEIQFSVVWVYSFDYFLKEKKALPVFKIFKRKSTNEAVFLDAFLKIYESWDCYLENAEFTESFLCVPRHGEYCFDAESNSLALEYMRSMKLKTIENECPFIALSPEPFSQRAIRPLFTVMTSFFKMTEKLEPIFHVLCSFLVKYKGAIFNVAVFIILIWRELRSRTLSLEMIIKMGYMLLNKAVETKDYSNVFKFESWADHLSTFLSEYPTALNSLNVSREIGENIHNFFNLLLVDEKDWLKIFRSFCVVFRKVGLELLLGLKTDSNCGIIKCLFWLLCIIEKLLEEEFGALGSFEIFTKKVNAGHENRNFENSSSESLAHFFSSSSAFDNRYQLPSTSDLKTQNAAVQVTHLSLREVLSNLPSLEISSTERMCNLLVENFPTNALENVLPRPRCSSLAEFGILLEKHNGFGIYLFPKASIPRLNCYISRLLKTEFSFLNTGIFTAEVIGRSGESLGFIFFLQEFSAFGLFPLEVIKEEEESLMDYTNQ